LAFLKESSDYKKLCPSRENQVLNDAVKFYT
jgi:hypothetical protein